MQKHAIAGETASIILVAATFLEFLPYVASLLAVVWWGMRIYQAWLELKNLKQKDKE